jgi:hypothetical protein
VDLEGQPHTERQHVDDERRNDNSADYTSIGKPIPYHTTHLPIVAPNQPTRLSASTEAATGARSDDYVTA